MSDLIVDVSGLIVDVSDLILDVGHLAADVPPGRGVRKGALCSGS
jgi:hypothetical protein